MGYPKRTKPLGKPGNRWEYNTKMIMKKSTDRTLTGFIWFRRRANEEGSLVKFVTN